LDPENVVKLAADDRCSRFQRPSKDDIALIDAFHDNQSERPSHDRSGVMTRWKTTKPQSRLVEYQVRD
jgi:hypothetical protein